MLEDLAEYRTVNDAFGHIGRRIKRHWGREEFIDYMNELLNDSRNGTRKGFSTDVLQSLQSIAQAHRAKYPRLSSESPWSRRAR